MRPWLIIVCCLFLVACQSAGADRRLKSRFIRQPSADFFLEYGPPFQAADYPAETTQIRPGFEQKITAGKLIYYWSSVNKKSDIKIPGTKEPACNLAILTSAAGQIERIEIQDPDDKIEAARPRCEKIVQ